MKDYIKFFVEKSFSNQLNKNEIKVKVEASPDNRELDDFLEYINDYQRVTLYALDGNELINININDILYFYSDKKYNYCKTLKKDLRINSKLYEIEKMDINFLRISKSCIININQVKCFDLSETGKIIVKFVDNSTQFVSRRKIKEVMDYLKERRI